jgi:L-ascorbate metabolism protein UlaG (beta-lactamase superfamily)
MAIKALPLKRGEIALTWFNKYAGVIVKSPHVTIVVDPVEVDPNIFAAVDAILVTHEHFDHLDESIVRDVQMNTNCIVIANPASYDRLSAAIPSEKLFEAHVKDEFQVKDSMVYAERSSHPAVEPLTYIITSEDGITTYHTSDSAPFSEMVDIGKKYQVDICFCTIGIAPGATLESGAKIAKLVQPKVAIPYHGERINDFPRVLSKLAPNIKCHIAHIGEALKYP